MLDHMFAISQLEPVATLTTLGLSLLQPHPVNAGGILFTYAAYQPLLIERGNNGWVAFVSSHTFVHPHVEVLEESQCENICYNQNLLRSGTNSSNALVLASRTLWMKWFYKVDFFRYLN